MQWSCCNHTWKINPPSINFQWSNKSGHSVTNSNVILLHICHRPQPSPNSLSQLGHTASTNLQIKTHLSLSPSPSLSRSLSLSLSAACVGGRKGRKRERGSERERGATLETSRVTYDGNPLKRAIIPLAMWNTMRDHRCVGESCENTCPARHRGKNRWAHPDTQNRTPTDTRSETTERASKREREWGRGEQREKVLERERERLAS